MRIISLVSLLLGSAPAGFSQVQPAIDDQMAGRAKEHARLLFDRYIASDAQLDAYYERFNSANSRHNVSGKSLRNWSPYFEANTVQGGLVGFTFGDIILHYWADTGEIRAISMQTGSDFFQSEGPLSPEQCAENVRRLYFDLGGRHQLNLVKAKVRPNTPYEAEVKFEIVRSDLAYPLDGSVEAIVSLRNGAPVQMLFPREPNAALPAKDIVSEEKAMAQAVRAVHSFLGWDDVEVAFHPARFIVPALGGYVNELSALDQQQAKTNTAKVIYFGTISQPRPWGRTTQPSDAWCLVWVDGETGRVLALAPSGQFSFGTYIAPVQRTRHFDWNGEWSIEGQVGSGALTGTTLGDFKSGKPILLSKGSLWVIGMYDEACNLVRVELSGEIHYARPDAQLRRLLRDAEPYSPKPFGRPTSPESSKSALCR